MPENSQVGGAADLSWGRRQDQTFKDWRLALSVSASCGVFRATLTDGLREPEASPLEPSTVLTPQIGVLPPPAPSWSHIPAALGAHSIAGKAGWGREGGRDRRPHGVPAEFPVLQAVTVTQGACQI